MGLFKKLRGNKSNDMGSKIKMSEDIIVLPSLHDVEDYEYGEDDSKYLMSFKINDVFQEFESHAGEVIMLNVYNPNNDYCEVNKLPYIAIQFDDKIYNAVEEFKEKGTFKDAIELTKLTGKFYFKAKIEYYQDMMYFYGFDRCNGFCENNGLCLVYPKAYVNTENELKLIGILDEVARSYNEQRCRDFD